MPNLFKRWLCNVKRDRKDLELKPPPDPPMPTLPLERARPLTATPCLPAATANSDLFQRIPPEIRREILIEAFGDLTVHFALHLLHPSRKNYTPKLLRYDTGFRQPHAHFPDHSERDNSAPRQWQWCGSVCHNLMPSARPISPCRRYFDDSVHCCSTGYADCHNWPGEMPVKCYIGAIGWLLTCRLAYIEGVEVLYATNRIRIHGIYLLNRLPDLLLPQRSATIRSVKLYWNIHPWRDEPALNDRHKYAPGSDMDGFTSLLKTLPVMLPNLAFLHLSLGGDFQIPGFFKLKLSEAEEFTLNASEALLQLVDQTVIKLHRLSYCCIVLPASYFRALKFKEKGIGFNPGHIIADRPLWREIAARNKAQHDERAEPTASGYWIGVGEHDWDHPDDYIPGPVCYMG